MAIIQRLTSIAEVFDRYDGFILDQFGVMHNGSTSLPGAAECVREMAQRGKKLIILSNSSSRSQDTMNKLPKLGFDPSHFVGAVTSGQEAAKYIRATHQNQQAIFLTWRQTSSSPRPTDFLQECGNVILTNDCTTADFVLLHGCEAMYWCSSEGEQHYEEETFGDYIESGSFDAIDLFLQSCLQHSLPMVCANPDFVMVRPNQTIAHMPGKIAQRYKQMGGTVHSFGKPNCEHFEACINKLGLPPARVVHVGDSLHHDIAGANAAGIDSIFIAGGVHREELGCTLGQLPPAELLQNFFAKHNIVPMYVAPMLQL